MFFDIFCEKDLAELKKITIFAVGIENEYESRCT